MCHLGLRTLKMYFYVLKLERCVAAAIKFLNKMSGQTWCKKNQTAYNLGWIEYLSENIVLLYFIQL